MARNIRRFVRAHTKIFSILASIGVVALILALYLFFFVHTGIPSPITSDKELKVGTYEFLSTFATITKSPLLESSPVVVLNNGDEFLPDLITSIDGAKDSIEFTTYIWTKGEFSTQAFGALTRAAARGVSVHILFDGYAGNPPKAELIAFINAGGKAARLRPFWSDPVDFNSRDHRRAIVIDDTIAYTGGMAIQDEWLGNGRTKDQWRDTMFRMQGTMAQSVKNAFADQWLGATGEVLTNKGLSANPTVVTANESIPFVPVVGSAGDKNHPITDAFILTALGAQKSLYITNPYVLPDDALVHILMEKANAGVDVRLLMPGKETDAPLVRFASHAYYTELLESGVRIYEYQPSLIHEKAMVTDGVWSLIGSANIDNRSREINDENVMGIQDPLFAETLTKNFTDDLQYSKEITKEAWRNRWLWRRAVSSLSAIFYKQF